MKYELIIKYKGLYINESIRRIIQTTMTIIHTMHEMIYGRVKKKMTMVQTIYEMICVKIN